MNRERDLECGIYLISCDLSATKKLSMFVGYLPRAFNLVIATSLHETTLVKP